MPEKFNPNQNPFKGSGKRIPGGLKRLAEIGPIDKPKLPKEVVKREIQGPAQIQVTFKNFKNVFEGGLGTVKRSGKIRQAFSVGQEIVLTIDGYLPSDRAAKEFISTNNINQYSEIPAEIVGIKDIEGSNPPQIIIEFKKPAPKAEPKP